MRRHRQKIVRFAAAALLIALVSRGAAAADPAVDASACSIAAGRDARNNTLTCNFGLTPEQLKQVTDAAVKGATGPLLDARAGEFAT